MHHSWITLNLYSELSLIGKKGLPRLEPSVVPQYPKKSISKIIGTTSVAQFGTTLISFRATVVPKQSQLGTTVTQFKTGQNLLPSLEHLLPQSGHQ